MDPIRLKALAIELAAAMPPLPQHGAPRAPKQAKEPPYRGRPPRDAIIRRIRWLADNYALGWLIDQARWPDRRLSDLDDTELTELLAQTERARECWIDGIAFDDAGLVRHLATKAAS